MTVRIVTHSGGEESEEPKQSGSAQERLVPIQGAGTLSSQSADEDNQEGCRRLQHRQPEFSGQLSHIVVEMTVVSRHRIRR